MSSLMPSFNTSFKECVPCTKFAHNAVDNGDILVPHVVDHDLADIRLLDYVPVPCS